MVSFFIFAFLSVPAFTLGIISIVLYAKDKKAGQDTNLAALICGILATLFGLVGFVSMIVNMITLINKPLRARPRSRS